MDFKRLQEFVRKHGKVSFIDSKGTSHTLPSGGPDIHALVEEGADRFLWDGLSRSRAPGQSVPESGVHNPDMGKRLTPAPSSWGGKQRLPQLYGHASQVELLRQNQR
jgi:hypothetical protein